MDVDFLLRQVPNTPEQLKSYAGIGASIVARIKNTRTPFSIDFGVGDVIVPQQEKSQIPTQLPEFESPTVNTYSVETTVAEKLDAILSLIEFSSRMKDYYDLYYIANKFDFDGGVLTEALRKTFSNREHSFSPEQFEQVMSFGDNVAMQKKWKAFVRKINTKTDDYSSILKTIRIFLEKPFTYVVLLRYPYHQQSTDQKLLCLVYHGFLNSTTTYRKIFIILLRLFPHPVKSNGKEKEDIIQCQHIMMRKQSPGKMLL